MAKKWADALSDDVYTRLCNCRTLKADLPELVNAKWQSYIDSGKADGGFTKEDALVSVLELLESNSQVFDLGKEEYDSLCS